MKPLTDKQRQHLAAVARGGVTGSEFRLETTFHDAKAEGQAQWLDGRTMRSLETRGLVTWTRLIGKPSFSVKLTTKGATA